MSDTETIDRLFLELSQFTKAETEKEIALRVERDEAIGARDHFRSEADRLHKCFGTIDRLRVDLAQEKRWGLEAHERAGGVEERLRQIAKDAYFEGREDERHFQPGDDPDEDWENSDAKRALDGEKVVPDEKP